ncbi:MAG TPA: hypothetical protein VFF50_03005 [Candidatus Deferrimicrobiaceae bacterium]|nr:hypothetical protein [Candidatus Deferrimicrobiaceae bacterium]
MKFIAYTTLATLTLAFALSASARDVVLPAGTLLQCTLNEPNFSPSTAAVGDPVLCHLRGVTEFGQEAFPRGSYLVGHLESAKEPGHFFGKGHMKLQFDRIGLPSGDLPLDAKVIATRGYKVDKEGDIRGKGHARRDAVEWMLPPLWPWKVIMLPARGPQPALKGESVMTLRLMDDVQVPQLAQRASLGQGWHYFNQPRNESFEQSQLRQSTPQLSVRARTSTSDLELTVAPHASYASLVTSSVPANPGSTPSMPVFVLTTGMALSVSSYGYQDGRITYTLASGGSGVISTDDIDWATTTRVNAQRGVRVTLHGRHQSQATPGMEVAEER